MAASAQVAYNPEELAKQKAAELFPDPSQNVLENYQAFQIAFRVVSGTARRMLGDVPDCDDVAQDALYRALKELDRFRGQTSNSFYAFLNTAAKNIVKDHRKRAARHEQTGLLHAVPDCRHEDSEPAPFDAPSGHPSIEDKNNRRTEAGILARSFEWESTL